MLKQQHHPRPQCKRILWQSLDGSWTLNQKPIQVPFPPQSAASGYCGDIGDTLHYSKTFIIPQSFVKPRILLHFGAVDQLASVTVNGRYVGEHKGGYLPFCMDITDMVDRVGENTLQVKVTDALSFDYPYGKQRKKRGGMWYTPVSGIWQSVWLENVPEQYIQALRITPDLRGIDITVEGVSGFTAAVTLEDGSTKTYAFDQNCGRIDLENPNLWTPDSPYLYPLTVTAGEDRVESYFALRTVDIEERSGINRICLNGNPIFLHGVLDQGYFPNGIYTPDEEDAYEKDILRMKELGFNLLRKHIKIEPERFYESCDRLGMLVLQDMPNSGRYHFVRETALPTLGFKRKQDHQQGGNSFRKNFFTAHMLDTVKALYSHPCIIGYTIFNEGWGQFDADEHYKMLKNADPTRLVDATSGWFWQKDSDFDSEHIYFKTKKLHPGKRPLLISECGGYTLKIAGHLFDEKKHYGYGSCKDSDLLTERIAALYEKMILPAIKDGLCGCVYTQLSDIEEELNGFYTYDRKVCKVDKMRIKALSDTLYSTLAKTSVKP